MLRFEDVAGALGPRIASGRLIAIDGLPVSGKSTLAERLGGIFDVPIVSFDDFVLPRRLREKQAPAFQFPFFRIDEFYRVVAALRRGEAVSYRPFDWKTGRIHSAVRVVEPIGPIVVEGCSTLDPALAALFDLKLFIESDATTLMQARTAKDGGSDADNWQKLYLPSVALYMQTQPQRRADILVAGRGA